MIGAILGDMIGSPYEFIKNGNGKTMEFPLFVERSTFFIQHIRMYQSTLDMWTEN